jgi:hypothetical protein
VSDYLEDRTEAEWEKYLQEDDAYSARCFQLLERYLHMPDGDSLMSKQLAKEFPENDLTGMLAGWEYAEEMRSDAEWQDPDNPDLLPGDSADPFQSGGNPADAPLKPTAFWANTKELQDQIEMLDAQGRTIISVIIQCMADWCNILPLAIPPQERVKGLQALFRLARAFCNFKRSMEGIFVCLSLSNVAACKRALLDIQTSRKIILEFADKSDNDLKKLLTERGQWLQNCADNLQKQIDDCRNLIAKHGSEGRY